jgi:outer membrane protein OmpA-like peptidoglycan-associated protein
MKKANLIIICFLITINIYASHIYGNPTLHYYVILGGFEMQKNAESFTAYLHKLSYPAEYAYNAERNLYYVFISNTDDKQSARDLLFKTRENNKFKDAWIYTGVLPGTEVQELAADQQRELHTTSPISPESVHAEILTENTTLSTELHKPERKPFVFQLLNKSTNTPIAGNIKLMESEKDGHIDHYNANEISFIPAPKNKNGQLIIECDLIGYKHYKHKINYTNLIKDIKNENTDHHEVIIPIKLELIKRGNYIELEGVKFHKNSSIMLPESEHKLLELYNLMNNNPGYKISLHGHVESEVSTDITTLGKSNNFFEYDSLNHKSHESGKTLSKHRADAIKAYLVSKGIKANRIQTKGFGAMLAIYEQSIANERVEIEIR